MKNKSILLKILLSSLIYVVSNLSIIYVVYVIDFFGGTILLGIICGAGIMAVSYSKTLKQTVLSMVGCIISAIAANMILLFSGVPYRILMYIYRNESWMQEIGHLTVNEVIGYNFGIIFFWWGLITSLTVLFIIVFLLQRAKRSANNTATFCNTTPTSL